MFGNVLKITLFKAKFLIKVCLVLCAGPIGTRNQNPRSLPNLFRHYKSNDGLRIAKQAKVKKYIFRGKHYQTVLLAILGYLLLGLCFRNRAYI